jgi:hypothetical protein
MSGSTKYSSWENFSCLFSLMDQELLEHSVFFPFEFGPKSSLEEAVKGPGPHKKPGIQHGCEKSEIGHGQAIAFLHRQNRMAHLQLGIP